MRKTTLLFALAFFLSVAFANTYLFNWYLPLVSNQQLNLTNGTLTNISCTDPFLLCTYPTLATVDIAVNETYMATQFWAYGPIPWENLSSIPVPCPVGQAFTNLSGAGTCDAFLNETPYQTSAGGWTNTTSATTTNYNTTINGTLNVTGNTTANAGIMISTTATRPTCSSSIRGDVWTVQGGVGVTDLLEWCAKNSTNSYNWVLIARGD